MNSLNCNKTRHKTYRTASFLVENSSFLLGKTTENNTDLKCKKYFYLQSNTPQSWKNANYFSRKQRQYKYDTTMQSSRWQFLFLFYATPTGWKWNETLNCNLMPHKAKKLQIIFSRKQRQYTNWFHAAKLSLAISFFFFVPIKSQLWLKM